MRLLIGGLLLGSTSAWGNSGIYGFACDEAYSIEADSQCGVQALLECPLVGGKALAACVISEADDDVDREANTGGTTSSPDAGSVSIEAIIRQIEENPGSPDVGLLIDTIATHPQLHSITPEQASSTIRNLSRVGEPKEKAERLRQQIADSVVSREIAGQTATRPESAVHLPALARHASPAVKRLALDWALARLADPDPWIGLKQPRTADIGVAIRELVKSYSPDRDRYQGQIDDVLVRAIRVDPRGFPPDIQLEDSLKLHHGYAQMWRQFAGGAKALSPEGRKRLRSTVFTGEAPHPATAMYAVYAMRVEGPEQLMALAKAFEEEARISLGDRKARWLMARAYAAIGEIRPTWTVLKGRPYLEEAFSVAESEEIKRSIVRWIVLAEAASGHTANAYGLLETHKTLYANEAGIAERDELREQISRAAKGYQRAIDRQQRYEAGRRMAELERRLERARQTGNQEQIDRYTRLLSKIEQ